MKVKQIATILNETLVPQALGESDVVLTEDLSNIVEVGEKVSDYVASNNVDNAVKKIIDKVGKTINWTRPYIGMAPNIIRDSWEYGSILEKNRASLVDYTENPAWSLQNGTDYLDGKYYMPDVDSTLYNKKTTFEVNMSFAEKQFKESVRSAAGVASFFGMIESRIADSMTVGLDTLSMRVLCNLAIEHFKRDGKAVVNLLSLYNTQYSQSLTAAAALTDKSFLRFACMQIMLWKSRIRGIGQQFNLEEFDTHTPYDDQMLILHSDFAAGVKVFLESDTFHNDLLKFGEYTEVPYWQSSKGYTIANTMAIGGKPASGPWSFVYEGETINQNQASCAYVLGMLIDRDAAAICCEDSRVTTQYVPKGEFFTNFYKRDAEFLNDLAMNAIIFTLADPATSYIS